MKLKIYLFLAFGIISAQLAGMELNDNENRNLISIKSTASKLLVAHESGGLNQLDLKRTVIKLIEDTNNVSALKEAAEFAKTNTFLSRELKPAFSTKIITEIESKNNENVYQSLVVNKALLEKSSVIKHMLDDVQTTDLLTVLSFDREIVDQIKLLLPYIDLSPGKLKEQVKSQNIKKTLETLKAAFHLEVQNVQNELISVIADSWLKPRSKNEVEKLAKDLKGINLPPDLEKEITQHICLELFESKKSIVFEKDISSVAFNSKIKHFALMLNGNDCWGSSLLCILSYADKNNIVRLKKPECLLNLPQAIGFSGDGKNLNLVCARGPGKEFGFFSFKDYQKNGALVNRGYVAKSSKTDLFSGAFSLDGRYFASFSDGRLYLHECLEHHIVMIACVEDFKRDFYNASIGFSDDAHYLFVSFENFLYLYDCANKDNARLVKKFDYRGRVHSAEFISENRLKFVVANLAASRIVTYDCDKSKKIPVIKEVSIDYKRFFPSSNNSVDLSHSMSPYENCIVTCYFNPLKGSETHAFSCEDFNNFKHIEKLSGENSKFSPDGELLLCYKGKKLYIYDVNKLRFMNQSIASSLQQLLFYNLVSKNTNHASIKFDDEVIQKDFERMVSMVKVIGDTNNTNNKKLSEQHTPINQLKEKKNEEKSSDDESSDEKSSNTRITTVSPSSNSQKLLIFGTLAALSAFLLTKYLLTKK